MGLLSSSCGPARWLFHLARRLRVLAVHTAISLALCLVPFVFALGRLLLNCAERWQRERVALTGEASRALIRDLVTGWVSPSPPAGRAGQVAPVGAGAGY